MKFDEINYPNLLPFLEFNTQKIESCLATYPLVFISIKNAQVEWKMKFPMFVPVFYDYILKEKNLPTQEQFWQYYLSSNAVFFQKKQLSDELLNALKARGFRTYPSLVRDLHFCFFMKEEIIKGQVIYNIALDIEMGIDVLIQTKTKLYGVNLYTQTTRAKYARGKKKHRHQRFENVVYVELPVDFKGSKKCGSFFLYGERELIKLRQTVVEKKQWK